MNREPLKPITDAEVAAFARDGAVALRGVFDADWIALLAEGVEQNLAAPGPYVRHYTKEGESGRFVGDYCNWQRIAAYRRFAFESPAAGVAARLMGATKINLFHEHILVKEMATGNRTPWHHDQPYWTVDGDQVCSIWVPLDPVPRETCVEFLAGSHRWGKWYTPKRFNDLADHDTNEGEPCPISTPIATTTRSSVGNSRPATASRSTPSPYTGRRATARLKTGAARCRCA